MIALWGVKSSQQIPDHVEPFCIQHQSAREDQGFIVVFPLVRKLQNRGRKLPAEVKPTKLRTTFMMDKLLKPCFIPDRKHPRRIEGDNRRTC